MKNEDFIKGNYTTKFMESFELENNIVNSSNGKDKVLVIQGLNEGFTHLACF